MERQKHLSCNLSHHLDLANCISQCQHVLPGPPIPINLRLQLEVSPHSGLVLQKHFRGGRCSSLKRHMWFGCSRPVRCFHSSALRSRTCGKVAVDYATRHTAQSAGTFLEQNFLAHSSSTDLPQHRPAASRGLCGDTCAARPTWLPALGPVGWRDCSPERPSLCIVSRVYIEKGLTASTPWLAQVQITQEGQAGVWHFSLQTSTENSGASYTNGCWHASSQHPFHKLANAHTQATPSSAPALPMLPPTPSGSSRPHTASHGPWLPGDRTTHTHLG